LQRNAVPGIAVDVVVDREEDGGALAAARRGVQAQAVRASATPPA
jgi:hypothetical protein